MSTAPARLASLGLLAAAMLLVGFSAEGNEGVDEAPDTASIFGPELGSEPVPPAPRTPLERVAARGQVTPTVRLETYRLFEPHPLIAEAAEILTVELRPYAEGVYVTSVARTPEDQRRLMKTRKYRYWTTPRSKHLLGGLAADIGFVGRRTSMTKMRDRAEAILEHVMGEARARKIRVVKESRCIHIEIDTWKGKDIVTERVAQLAKLGIVKVPEGPHPVPALEDYVPESVWAARPRNLLKAVPF